MFSANQLKFKLAVSIFIVAVILGCSSNLALAQKHEENNASSNLKTAGANSSLVAERINSVFQMVNKLQKAKGADLKAFEKITAQEFDCLSTFMYLSEYNPNSDITRFEMPFNKNYKILYVEFSINPDFVITLRDVQKCFGKWERQSKSKGNAEEKILPEYRCYFDHGSLAFNFRSPNHKTLTSITVYYDR